MGDQATEVKTTCPTLGCLEGLLDDVVLAELALLDRQVDADNVLPDDTASTNVEMADFGVAHEALGEANGKRRSVELSEAGRTFGQLVHHRGVGSGNGISILGRFLGGDTPAVNHDYMTE